MSPQSPKVLSRRANGVGSGPSGQTNESSKVRSPGPNAQVTLITNPGQGKSSQENKGSGKPGRGRGGSGKANDNTKVEIQLPEYGKVDN